MLTSVEVLQNFPKLTFFTFETSGTSYKVHILERYALCEIGSQHVMDLRVRIVVGGEGFKGMRSLSSTTTLPKIMKKLNEVKLFTFQESNIPIKSNRFYRFT